MEKLRWHKLSHQVVLEACQFSIGSGYRNSRLQPAYHLGTKQQILIVQDVFLRHYVLEPDRQVHLDVCSRPDPPKVGRRDADNCHRHTGNSKPLTDYMRIFAVMLIPKSIA